MNTWPSDQSLEHIRQSRQRAVARYEAELRQQGGVAALGVYLMFCEIHDREQEKQAAEKGSPDV